VYALLNYWCQGSSADILKTMMLELDAAGLGPYMVLPVHDELIFSIPEGDTTTIQEAARIMTWPDRLSVPLDVDVNGPAPSWGAVEK
jgi:DNA polymerase-1